jgi:putative endonuclease
MTTPCWSTKDNQEIKTHYIYILRCCGDKYYVGMTSHLIDRMYRHTTGQGAKFTRRNLPCQLVHLEAVDTLLYALKKEIDIRKMVVRGWREFYLPIEFSEFFYRIAAMASRSDKNLMNPLQYFQPYLENCHEFIKVPEIKIKNTDIDLVDEYLEKQEEEKESEIFNRQITIYKDGKKYTFPSPEYVPEWLNEYIKHAFD